MKTTRLTALIAALFLLACDGAALTELMVVIDSDIEVPGMLDAVRVEVEGATDMIASGSLTGAGGAPLPRTVGIVHRGGAFGPVRVHVFGSLAGTDVVSTHAITSFLEGRTLVLPMFLSAQCRPVTCGADETCNTGVCVSANVDPTTLVDWTGGIPQLDGGGGCVMTPERCDGSDNDCDGTVDEGFDIQTDPMNCGGCTRSCARANAMTECSGGTCSITACNAGFDDCDTMEANGCEADVSSDVMNCGGCEMPCMFANATAACNASTCELLACNTGFDDCDTMDSNGCERPLNTLTDCGSCGMACAVTAPATATCATGTCEIDQCNMAGLDDCNGDPTDGCETMTNTPTDCGACNTPCDIANATESCDTGTCLVVACDAGFGDCDMDNVDCEQQLNTLAHCGACGMPCTVPNGTATCATGTCEVATCSSADLADCNGDPTDGCEADLRTDDNNCDMCGNVCPAGNPDCRMRRCR